MVSIVRVKVWIFDFFGIKGKFFFLIVWIIAEIVWIFEWIILELVVCLLLVFFLGFLFVGIDLMLSFFYNSKVVVKNVGWEILYIVYFFKVIKKVRVLFWL